MHTFLFKRRWLLRLLSTAGNFHAWEAAQGEKRGLTNFEAVKIANET